MLLAVMNCGRTSVVPVRLVVPGKLQLTDLWSRATVVAAGDLAHVERIGSAQQMNGQEKNAPVVYPCQADFLASIVIKGQGERAKRKLLWFSYFPSCIFEHRTDRRTR